MAAMKAKKPWANLHEDLLDQIFEYLLSFAERAYCTGVCRNWRLYAMQREDAVSPTLPWLLRPSTAGASYFRIFSRTSTDEPAVPGNARGARFIGSVPGGWFIVARGQWRGYALLNIRTGDEVPLPDGLRRDEIPDELDVGIDADVAHPRRDRVPGADPGRSLHHRRHNLGPIQDRVLFPGMDRWMPVQPDLEDDSESWKVVMREEFEDVIYYRCDEHEDFYFLTSQERLLVFDIAFCPDEEDEDGVVLDEDFTLYNFPGHRMTASPEAGQNVAGRYLVEADSCLLMVKRFTSPGRGTVSFQVFVLQWRNSEPYWQRTRTLTGLLLFIARGCSRAFETGKSGPGYIFFLDDDDVFRDSSSIVLTEKQYCCSDAGWCSYSTQHVRKPWPPGRQPHSSPWVWLFH